MFSPWPSRYQSTLPHLAAPAHPQPTPCADIAARLVLNLLHDFWNLLRCLRWCSWTLEESSKLLAFLLGVRRIPRMVGWLAEEEIRDEDLVLVLFVGVCEDVGTLECLFAEAEDVIDD